LRGLVDRVRRVATIATAPRLAALVAAALVTASCGGPGGGGMPSADTGSIGKDTGTVKVALLLPTTGSSSSASVAKALRQAGELALFDFNNPNVTLIPKDTHGTPDGARAAAQSAVQDGAELIVGPLFSSEVRAAAPVARDANIPMIAFSSDPSVAGNGVYLLSFPAGADVPRISSFALQQGKRSFAVLVPESAYGKLAEAAFARTVAQAGGRTVVRATYSPSNPSGMAGPVHQIANAINQGQHIDALFLPAGKDELPSLAPLLAQSGLSSAKVQFIGTGQWDYPGIGQQQAFVGAWYPAPDPKGWADFSQRYQKTYGSQPPRLASLAYDAVSLAVSLSQNPPGQRYTPDQLTRPTGFAGVDGLFRLKPDGTPERGLAILQVEPNGPRVIDAAPQSFASNGSGFGNVFRAGN
jgi:ABC-type branched-subunit amino acid transport system substrate-binding protein